MSHEPAEGSDAEVPDAVMDWLESVAAERGVSEAELLQTLLAGPDGTAGDAVSERELDRVEEEFRELVQDVRERIVQVKREADEKAPADHSHHDLRHSMEQMGREIGAIEAQVEGLEERLGEGFDNYEEILTYLTDTTDELNRRLGRLASAVVDLRERVGEAARDEIRRTALSHLTDTANRHGIDSAKCEDCGEAVDLSLLVEPRCPHCESSFSTVEPKSGFFRSSVLHTGTMPALESAPDAPEADDELAAMVDEAAADADAAAPDVSGPGSRDAEREETEEAREADEAGADEPDAPEPADEEADDDQATDRSPAGDGDLETIDGVGSAYAERLEAAGIDDLLALAVADPEELGEAIDVPASRVADWVEQADARTSAS